MTESQDNAGEVVAATVRVMLLAAGQLAEQAARRREAATREAERQSQAAAATLQAQLASERQLALRTAQDVLRRGSTVGVEEIAHAREQIGSWQDPVATAERDRLEDLVRRRFGVDSGPAGGRPTGAATSGPSASRDAPTVAAVVVRDAQQQATDARGRAERLTASRAAVKSVLAQGSQASLRSAVGAWEMTKDDDWVLAEHRDRVSHLLDEHFGVDVDVLDGYDDAQLVALLGSEPEPVTAASAGRGAAPVTSPADRVGAVTAHLEGAGIDRDTAQAQALAAQSHPTSPTLAAQPSKTAPKPVARRRGRTSGVEMQGPGR